MNRRNFVSMLLGAAGAGVVLWRLPERRIVLPPRYPRFAYYDEVPFDLSALRDEFLVAVADTYRIPLRYLSGETGPLTLAQESDLQNYFAHFRRNA